MKYINILFTFINLLFVLNVNAGLLSNLGSIFSNESNKGKDISFGTPRKLDVYYDEKGTDSNNLKPVVIWVHGGAWVEGDKGQYANFGKVLKENGYVGVVPDYVLFPFGKIDTMVNDIYSAIMWTRENIAKYGGDPSNITVSGHSAGAHLIALTVLKAALGYKNKGDYLEPLTFLKKLVLLNGPYDFDDYSLIKQLFNFPVSDGIVEEAITMLLNDKNISPTDLLKRFNNKSVGSLGIPKIVFFYTSEDIVVPPTSADGLISEIERTAPETDIRYIYLHNMNHNTLTHGVKNDEDEFKELYINLIQM
ncbi:alpha/beta-hydrolase [Anaeromyces robustus]|uniref:Alpha/beta-hydrolase n=1 Tax=Anaeromyces robustus TaxID=1754192 RepID=A0A1Y1X230_9FUNG|nr:alpha/beta-hydrolase [Anaeromyces robustus]|eukprot:ORX79860.1 alpha/beta-hydrolase [Anaeromyces robustus]